jgi:hypothetical protein
MFAVFSTILLPLVARMPREVSRLSNACCEGSAGYLFLRSGTTSPGDLHDLALRNIGLERSRIEAALYGCVTIRDQRRR